MCCYDEVSWLSGLLPPLLVTRGEVLLGLVSLFLDVVRDGPAHGGVSDKIKWFYVIVYKLCFGAYGLMLCG